MVWELWNLPRALFLPAPVLLPLELANCGTGDEEEEENLTTKIPAQKCSRGTSATEDGTWACDTGKQRSSATLAALQLPGSPAPSGEELPHKSG